MDPFLKWAGGKRWLLPKLKSLAPPHFRRYFEPFLGGGAFALELGAQSGLLSDKNPDLILTYQILKTAPKELRDRLARHSADHKDSYYYLVRENSPSDPIDRAARFIYLNRTCWNGLYRVNRQGRFNVPRGTKNLILYPNEDFENLADRLSNYDISCMDFESAIAQAQHGDLVYADPPYTVAHNLNGFLKYNATIFSWADQERLEASLREATERGVHVIISNADHSSVRELYRDWPQVSSISRHSVIAGSAGARKATSELLIASL